MEELFRKIYDTIICYEEDAVEMGKGIDREINELMKPFQTKLTEVQLEEMRDLISVISISAEREGFLLGAKYTLKMLTVLLSN